MADTDRNSAKQTLYVWLTALFVAAFSTVFYGGKLFRFTALRLGDIDLSVEMLSSGRLCPDRRAE